MPGRAPGAQTALAKKLEQRAKSVGVRLTVLKRSGVDVHVDPALDEQLSPGSPAAWARLLVRLKPAGLKLAALVHQALDIEIAELDRSSPLVTLSNVGGFHSQQRLFDPPCLECAPCAARPILCVLQAAG